MTLLIPAKLQRFKAEEGAVVRQSCVAKSSGALARRLGRARKPTAKRALPNGRASAPGEQHRFTLLMEESDGIRNVLARLTLREKRYGRKLPQASACNLSI